MRSMQQKFHDELVAIVDAADGFDVAAATEWANTGTWHVMHGWAPVLQVRYDFQGATCGLTLTGEIIAGFLQGQAEDDVPRAAAGYPMYRIVDDKAMRWFSLGYTEHDRIADFWSTITHALECYESMVDAT